MLSQPSPTAPISYDFVFFACLSFLSLCLLSFSAFRVCQRHFITRLLIFVRKYRLIHCISIYYRDFCEGCESKKCKTPVVCVRAYAREAPKHTFFTNDKISSFVYYFSLSMATTKGPTKKKLSRTFLQKRGRFSKKRGRFFQKRRSFSKISPPLSLSHIFPKRDHPALCKALLLSQAMVLLQNWACFAFGQRLLPCRTSAFITAPRDLKAQKSGCVKF